MDRSENRFIFDMSRHMVGEMKATLARIGATIPDETHRTVATMVAVMMLEAGLKEAMSASGRGSAMYTAAKLLVDTGMKLEAQDRAGVRDFDGKTS